MEEDFRGWPHAMISGFGCDRSTLMSYDTVYKFLKDLPAKIGMRPMGLPIVYKVTEEDHPDIGITGVGIIATSHMSIHTFPNGQKDGKAVPGGVLKKVHSAFFTFDCYSCKDFDFNLIREELQKAFRPEKLETALVYRLRDEESMIEVEEDY